MKLRFSPFLILPLVLLYAILAFLFISLGLVLWEKAKSKPLIQN